MLIILQLNYSIILLAKRWLTKFKKEGILSHSLTKEAKVAVPRDHKSILTNLPFPKLESVLDAVVNKLVVWDHSKTSLILDVCRGEFEFERARYIIEESAEWIASVYSKKT